MDEERAQAKERRERIKRLLADPNLLDTITCHIANGGTLIELCETWDVTYGHIMNWIREDQTRNKRYIDSLNDRAEWGVERILQEFRRLGLSDVRELFTDKGILKDPKDWPKELAAAVQSVEVFEEFAGRGDSREMIGYTKKVKLWDKVKSLELLGKNLSMFTDKVEHSGKVTLAELVAGSKDESDE